MNRTLRVPTREQAENYLREGEALAPGTWAVHSRTVALGAKLIAQRLPHLDANVAEIFGLLHDIGRRTGARDQTHIMTGYDFMMNEGYPDVARISLTHSYPHKDISTQIGTGTLTSAQQQFLQSYLDGIEYDDYDRLLQVCDALSFAEGFCVIEVRLVDVAMRYGIRSEQTAQWRAFLDARRYFERQLGCSIYSILPNVAEVTLDLASR